MSNPSSMQTIATAKDMTQAGQEQEPLQNTIQSGVLRLTPANVLPSRAVHPKYVPWDPALPGNRVYGQSSSGGKRLKQSN